MMGMSLANGPPPTDARRRQQQQQQQQGRAAPLQLPQPRQGTTFQDRLATAAPAMQEYERVPAGRRWV